jgi:antibiotic biosynthesis monooxygenase (ABM) superfamily enzyme
MIESNEKPGGTMSAASAIDAPRPLVHVAILRKVRRDHEAEFESQIARFFQEAGQQPGVCGAYLIRPVAGSTAREYGILRTFESEAAMRRFYDSDLYAQWQEAVRPLVEGEPQKHRLHGLEAFFRGGAAPPPLWKMAIITWIGVNPAVYIFSNAVTTVFGQLPMLVALLLINAFVVASLTWIFMPVLTRLFSRWLQPRDA